MSGVVVRMQRFYAGSRRRLLRVAAASAVLLASGCSSIDAGLTAQGSPTALATRLPPVPTASGQSRTPAAGTPRCPARPFDPRASLGPIFENDIFVNDESRAIAEAFLTGLSAIYSNDEGTDPCDWFTDVGWASAVEWDPRIDAADRGTLAIEQAPIVRVAFENGVYDLRERPPVVPLDIIFDIPAGVTTTDLASGDTSTSTSTAVERIGLRAVFMFDGHRWRADFVGQIDAAFRDYLSLPTIPPRGPECSGFARDDEDAPFDDRGSREWCDADGNGRVIRQGDQLVLLTRYPCGDGHAAILHIGQPLGSTLDPLVRWEYVRDPANEFLAQRWLTEPFAGDVALPPDAASTGWTNGNIDLWISPSELDRAVYIVRGDIVERWPRAAEQWGVTDCN